MNLSPLSWQDLNISYPFKPIQTSCEFLDFQPNIKQALKLFQQSEMGTALIVKSDTLPDHFLTLSNYFEKQNTPVIWLNEYHRNQLFGYHLYLEKENKTQWVEGVFSKIQNGVLILNLHALLLDITQWDKLKQALLFAEFTSLEINAIPHSINKIPAHFKLVLLGSRDDIATLYDYDTSLYQFAHYAEFQSYLMLNNDNIQQWADYIQTQSQQWTKKSFTSQGLNQFLNALIRESESQSLIAISPDFVKKQLRGLQSFYPEATEFDDIQDYFDDQEHQSAQLHRYALQDMLTEQIYVETEGEAEGQINGLSVVEFDGVPHAFGEPLRISCNVQFGEGEIHDIERKVELGGNIHAKGIFLAQSCLAHLLELPAQLPFSASLAFEQSYGEIDGDSSSLAIFSVLVSALAKLPLPQSLAVTGAIDQFGNVLSVGGVNQKIEGFFALCQARGLSGKQGVIIPACCISHLSLRAEVIAAVKAEQFHIWAVNDVFEAVELLFNHPFYAEEGEHRPALFQLIHQQLENPHDHSGGKWWGKIQKIFTRPFG